MILVFISSYAYISKSKWLHLEGIFWMIWTFVLKCWHLLLTLFEEVCSLALSPLHLVDTGDCLNSQLYSVCKLCLIGWLHAAIYSQYMYTYMSLMYSPDCAGIRMNTALDQCFWNVWSAIFVSIALFDI